MVALGVALMLPVSLASGLLFTLLGAALRAESSGDAVAAARLTLFNTAGGAAGALGAAFVLLPVVGMERSLFAIALSYAACAVLLVSPARDDRPTRLAVYVLGSVVLHREPGAFRSARNRRRGTSPRQSARWSIEPQPHVEVREGLGETIRYVERRFADRPRSQRLVTNGISMSSSDFPQSPLHEAVRLLADRGASCTEAGAAYLLRRRSDGQGAHGLAASSRRSTWSTCSRRPRDEPCRVPRPRRTRSAIRACACTSRTGASSCRRPIGAFDLITGEPPPPNLGGVETLYSRRVLPARARPAAPRGASRPTGCRRTHSPRRTRAP